MADANSYFGQKNRKGSLGRPYAVQDHYRVNPEFGTLADLKEFVANQKWVIDSPTERLLVPWGFQLFV